MKIEWVKKKWSEISLEELYSVLRLRSEVFVVEQDSVYQDIDNPFSPRRYAVKIENPIEDTKMRRSEILDITKPTKKVQTFVPSTL